MARSRTLALISQRETPVDSYQWPGLVPHSGVERCRRERVLERRVADASAAARGTTLTREQIRTRVRLKDGKALEGRRAGEVAGRWHVEAPVPRAPVSSQLPRGE